MRFARGEALIAEAGLRGSFVWRDARTDVVLVAFPKLAAERYLPASTFKIPNTLVALETGVAADESFRLPWDGVKRYFDNWNRDHDLRSALEGSVVWYNQELARRIGAARMRAWLERLAYGNAEMGAEVDRFWLAGPLAISALEQVRFVTDLTSGALPFSKRSVSILRDIMPREDGDGFALRAETGTYLDEESSHAWLVGWVERENGIAGHFALLLVGKATDVSRLRRARWRLAAALARAALARH